MTRGRIKSVEYWLAFMVLLIASMIVIGGATRLTNSGLSITEWAPIRGVLPPLSHEAWLAEFEKYKLIPEFEAEHPDMDLAGFKFIYFWEWVSQYRLATHLGMAFVILAAIFWLWERARSGWLPMENTFALKRSSLLAGLIYLQIIAGAFMAGTHSGRSYNEWPLMDGDFIPEGYGVMSPFVRNMFENSAAIQFNHRVLAYLILGFALWVVWSVRRQPLMRRSALVLLVILLWQVGLGIWTLLMVAPLNLSLLHQFSSILLFLAALNLVWRSRNTVK